MFDECLVLVIVRMNQTGIPKNLFFSNYTHAYFCEMVFNTCRYASHKAGESDSTKNRIFLPGWEKTTTASDIIRKYSARSKPR